VAEEQQSVEMSFWDHIEELRGTMFRSAAVIVCLALVFLCIKNPLFDFILAPSQENFFVYRLLGIDLHVDLINIEVSAQFFIHLKMAFVCGLIVAFPYIIYEIWKFIAPALYDNEKAVVKKAFMLASVLFYLGAAIGYVIVLPVCLNFFMNYSVSDTVINTISLNSYISLFISMVLMIGLIFEFPSVIAVLSRFGLVTREMLRKGRKIAFVAILVIAAIITPSDPFSMFVLAIPLYILYEFSIYLCKKDN